jgi:hypothetical protein
MPIKDVKLKEFAKLIKLAKKRKDQVKVDRLCADREAYKNNPNQCISRLSSGPRHPAVQTASTIISNTLGIDRSSTSSATRGHSSSNQTDQVQIIRTITEDPDGRKITQEQEVKQSQIQTESKWQMLLTRNAIHEYATVAATNSMTVRAKYNNKHFRVMSHERVDAVTQNCENIDLKKPLAELMRVDRRMFIKLLGITFKRQRALCFIPVHNVTEESLQLRRRWDLLRNLRDRLQQYHSIAAEIVSVLVGYCFESYVQRVFMKLTDPTNMAMSNTEAFDELKHKWGYIDHISLGALLPGMYVLADRQEQETKAVIDVYVQLAEHLLERPESARGFLSALAQSYLVKKMLTMNMHKHDVELYYHVNEYEGDHVIKLNDFANYQLVPSDYENIVAYAPSDNNVLVDHIKLEMPTVIKGYLDITLEAALWGESLSDTLLPKIKTSLGPYFNKRASKLLTPENVQAFAQCVGACPVTMELDTYINLKQLSLEPTLKALFHLQGRERQDSKEDVELQYSERSGKRQKINPIQIAKVRI